MTELPPPMAHHMHPADAAAFAAEERQCQFPRCHGPIEIRTLARHSWGPVERLLCLGHGHLFGEFYGVLIEPAPDERGAGGQQPSDG